MKDFCCFEPANMHCGFAYLPNAFQIRLDRLSNLISNKGDRIVETYSISLF